MKRFFLIFSILPFFVFGEDLFTLPQIPYFKSAGTSSSSLGFITTSNNLTNDFFNSQLSFLSSYHGIRFKTADGTLSYTSSSSVSSSASYDTSLFDLSRNGFLKLASCPLILFVDGVVSRSYFEGFEPPSASNILGSFKLVGSDSSYTYINVNSFKFLSLMVSSTNSVFRSYALSAFSSINSYLSSISSSVSSLVSNSSSGLDSFSDFASKYLLLNSFDLDSITNFNSSVFLGSLPGLGYSDVSDVSSLLDDLSSLPSSSFSSVISSFRSASDSLLSNALLAHSLDPSKSLDSYLSSPADSLGAIHRSASSHVVNPITNSIHRMNTNWVAQTKQQLADNTASITNQLQQWKRDLAGDHAANTNLIHNIGLGVSDISSSLTDSGIRIKDGHVTLDNDLLNVNVMNWPSSFEISLKAGQLDFVSEGLDSLQGYWVTWFDKWQLFVDAIFHDAVASNNLFLSSIDTRLSNINDWTNLLVSVYGYMTNSLATNSISSSSLAFDSLLLSDYSNYITNNHYSSFLDSVQNLFVDVPPEWSYIDFLDNFDVFVTRRGSGNWWRFISANQAILGHAAISNLSMMAYLYSNLVATVDFADSQLEGGFMGQASKVISSFPSTEELEYQLSSVTSSVYQAAAGFDDVYSSLGSASNIVNTSATKFYSSRSLPSVISFSIIPGHPFDIPVGEMSTLWSILRMGMAFAISIVNLILLPKFILKLFILMFGVYDKELHIADS